MKAKNVPFLWILAAALLAPAVSAQIPDQFTNLKVLPKDISRGDLVGLMRSMAGGLGLRCNGCHVGEDPNSPEGYDFASDEKELKKSARVMLEMVDEINGKLMPRLGKPADELLKVQCGTCHHGRQRPQSLRDLLAEVLDKEGREAALAQYRELRERYYGRGTFDFGPWQLINLAERLAKSDRVDDAYAVIELNLEFHPDFAMNQVFLGQYHSQRGETELAIRSFEKAMELDPETARRIEPLLVKLKGGGGG